MFLLAVNLAIAGCASGIALGWEGKYASRSSHMDSRLTFAAIAGGPVSALQSCAGMGAFSWFFDGKRLNEKV